MVKLAERSEHLDHTCHAVDCGVPVHPSKLMCPYHWAKVPLYLRDAVWKYYRRGQEYDKDPSPEYLIVQREAVNAVAAAEGKPTLPTLVLTF